MLKKLKQEVVNAGARFGAAVHDAWFKAGMIIAKTNNYLRFRAGMDTEWFTPVLSMAFEYIDNALWFMMGAHIGLLLLSGDPWHSPVIVAHTAASVMKGVGIELIFSKDQERIAKGVLYAVLISSWLTIVLNIVVAVE